LIAPATRYDSLGSGKIAAANRRDGIAGDSGSGRSGILRDCEDLKGAID
uniref:Copper-containing nitrite reductase n=1 Tax=Anisakis simplex TaxID=6269 RepID=A0A0M3JE65_ANISI